MRALSSAMLKEVGGRSSWSVKTKSKVFKKSWGRHLRCGTRGFANSDRSR